MQAKGFIKFIIIALVVASIYQLSFTFFKSTLVNKAEAFAVEQTSDMEENSEKKYQHTVAKNYYLDSIKNQEVFLGFTYDQIDKRSLNLGLDLKGGVSMLVEIDQADVLRKLSNSSKDETFNQAIDNAVAAQSNETGDFVSIFANEYKKLNSEAKLSGIFSPIEKFRDKITFDSSNEDVIEVLKEEIEDKNKETHNVLSTRIDEFGVAQPFISKPDANGRIYIELPGADNTDRIRGIIQSPAVLEFYKCVDASEAGNLLFQANEVLVSVLGLEETTDTVEIVQAVVEDTPVNNDDIDPEEDLSDTTTSLQDDLNALNAPTNLNGEDTTATSDGLFPLFDVLQPNIFTDEAGQQTWANSSVIAFVAKKDMDKVKEYLAYEEIYSIFSQSGIKLSWSAFPSKDAEGEYTDFYEIHALRLGLDKKAAISGDIITDSYANYDEFGVPFVNMSFNKIGTDKFGDVTKELAEQGNLSNRTQFLAIVLDNKVFSSPTVTKEIRESGAMISNIKDYDDAADLSTILKSGKLDAQINIPQEAVVGASMGKAGIKQGLTALAIGFLLVILFMVLYYNKAGIIANIALMVNILFIMGSLASMNAALTLPGLAGIVLTIGMAVDANVIIFERIKEELRKGKGLKLAISDGFSRSYSAIIDANVTTLITAATLLWLGAGPVKGFAIVLIIGIIASFISAVFLSRLIFEGLNERDKKVNFSMSWSENILKDANFDFLGKRKIAYAISAVIIIGGLVSMFTKGFELGVDFKGGRSYVVEFDQEVSTDVIRGELTEIFDNATPSVKTFGSDEKIQIITSYQIESKDPKTDSTITFMLYDAVKGNFAEMPSHEIFMRDALIQANKVDTSIADDIRNSALFAGTAGAFFIFIYLLIRFRRWQYGVGALGAVIHDTLILLSIFSILWGGWFPFSLEIEQKFIAAVLTVIGYSINDTVIVFDRIREYFDEHPSKDVVSNVNSAINSTLSRTLMTSFTTLLVVIILFVFGGEAIKGFSFALLIGILVGTYSSVFIASSILVDTMKGADKIASKEKK